MYVCMMYDRYEYLDSKSIPSIPKEKKVKLSSKKLHAKFKVSFRYKGFGKHLFLRRYSDMGVSKIPFYPLGISVKGHFCKLYYPLYCVPLPEKDTTA